MKITNDQANFLYAGLRNLFPNSRVKINKQAGTDEPLSITSNSDGVLIGSLIGGVCQLSATQEVPFTLYRSGTGLTISFSHQTK